MDFINIISDGLFPKKCIACSDIIEDTDQKDSRESCFCSICRITLEEISSPVCKQCGIPLPSDEGADVTCLKCLKSPPYFDSVTSSYIYGSAIKEAIERFKFHGVTQLGSSLSKLILNADRFHSIPEVSYVLPVPLHLYKLYKRGYNQSALLAKRIAKHLQVPLQTSLLKRTKNTKPQAELDFTEREKNVRGAFKIFSNKKLNGKKILLIDDILTTGSTASACAKELKKHGAKEVHVVTIARTVQG